jgi:CrcB protein
MTNIKQSANAASQSGYPTAFKANEFAAIALGGLLGALLRHAGELILPTVNQGFPWATFLENILGSFAIGFAVAFLARRTRHHLLSPFLVVGLIGSYTTFSTFAIGFWERIDAGMYALAWTYALSTLILGFAAVVFGHVCGSKKNTKS